VGPLFSPAWSAADEVNLLNAVEQAGFGNWTKVAQRMKPRTPEGDALSFAAFTSTCSLTVALSLECQEHYFKTYVYSKTAPLPGPVCA
jgi:hypothetical protein